MKIVCFPSNDLPESALYDRGINARMMGEVPDSGTCGTVFYSVNIFYAAI
jgi:hypothetical protein